MWDVLEIAVIPAAVVMAPLILEWMRTPVGWLERQGVEGNFTVLSHGVTRYRWIGPARGPIAVAVHGLTTPAIGMESFAEGLGSLGYRVLIYDLYGRGLSDAPEGPQDRAFFLQQLDDLIRDQGLEDDITLVGYSMGAAIVTAYAAENPHRVKRVIMVAGACVVMRESAFSRFCRKVPVLGDWLHGVVGALRLGVLIPLGSQRPEVSRVLMAQRQELKRRGYLPAVLASRRGMLAETQEREHRKLALEALPVIAIWAERDQVIPLAASTQLAQWNRNARQDVIKGATHALPYTHSVELTEAIRLALRS